MGGGGWGSGVTSSSVYGTLNIPTAPTCPIPPPTNPDVPSTSRACGANFRNLPHSGVAHVRIYSPLSSISTWWVVTSRQLAQKISLVAGVGCVGIVIMPSSRHIAMFVSPSPYRLPPPIQSFAVGW